MSGFTFIPRPGFEHELLHDAHVAHACFEGAEEAAKIAREIAPVSSEEDDPTPGSFRDSIHAEERPEGAALVADDEAAIYIELGTSDTPPHFTLRRAVEAAGLKRGSQ